MSHVRTQLRTALAAALAALPSAPTVHVNRTRAIDHTQTPCVRLSTPQESIEPYGLSSPMAMRDITALVEVFVAGAAPDALADQTGLEIEQAVAAAGTMGDLLIAPLQLRETTTEVDDGGSPPLAMLRMVYVAQIITLASAPETAI